MPETIHIDNGPDGPTTITLTDAALSEHGRDGAIQAALAALPSPAAAPVSTRRPAQERES